MSNSFWSCFEIEENGENRRLIMFDDFGTSSGEIGKTNKISVNGASKEGILICDSTMGISPLDIFTDILIEITDLKNFVHTFDIQPNENKTGLAIQAYLLFCQAANVSPSDPIEKSESNPIFEQELSVQPDDGDFEVLKKSEKYRKNSVKATRKPKAWSHDPVERCRALEEIRAACSKCVDQVSDLSHWEQDKFEQVLSIHLKEEHNYEDEFYLEKEYIEKLKKENGGAPKKIHITDIGDRYPCNHYPRCNTVFSHLIELYQHRVYHKEIDQLS